MQQCAKLIVLTLLSLQVSQFVAELVPEEDACVELVAGHHPFPGDCTGFIYCTDDGTALAGRCVDGLHFMPDPEIPGVGVCTYPEFAGCDPGAGTTPCVEGDFWEERVPQTCNQYRRCVNGEIENRQCTENLHWHETLRQCVAPNLSDCPYPICSENPTPGEVELLPHPTDCNLFYICIDQVPIEQSCSPGQHFDRINGWCTTPEEAGCVATRFRNKNLRFNNFIQKIKINKK